MTTIAFDTLKFVQTLEKAGVPPPQAEAFAEALKQAQSESELATRSDLRETEERISANLYKALLIQTFAIAGLVAALVKIF
ncbi:MAG: CCDC90 family protein [Rhodospirillales bacterium]|nr:CCDC90 family protein [Rhodospirillales bacterium]